MKDSKSSKPKVSNSASQKELDRAEKQFDDFDQEVKKLTLDRMNEAPREETQPQTQLSSKEIEKTNSVYLKPRRSLQSKEPFNEKYRKEYNFKKELVHFTAENREIIGESIEVWTKPFAGMPAEDWVVPVNKPVWGPRYLAERIKGCFYHRMRTEEKTITGSDGMGAYTGSLVVDNTIQRLDAHPVSDRKSVFVGASSF